MFSIAVLTTILYNSVTQTDLQMGQFFSDSNKPTQEIVEEKKITMPYDVPLYSQIRDISWTEWQQKGCGVADVAMLVNYYKPETTNVQAVLENGIKSGAYVKNVGWSHDGLAKLASRYGLIGKVHAFWDYDRTTALSEFKKIIDEGPAIASIHRNFDPKLSFGHLIVITGYDENFVYFNDPGKKDGIRTVPVSQFMNGWKRKLIVIRPIEDKTEENNTTKTQLAFANN